LDTWRETDPRVVLASMGMENIKVKNEAKRLVEELPEDATWDDLMYRIYVRQAVEAGLRDSDAGRTVSVDEVRARFGLPK
jgi:hypothetical protein